MLNKKMNKREHWENVYQTKTDHEVSWFREHLDNSLKLILEAGVERDAAIIDIGGGSSTLVDDLLDRGFVDVTVLDISTAALDRSKQRLGRRSEEVEWKAADITEAALTENRYDVWHDRAVFHFLTDEADRRKYIDLVMRSLKPGGHTIVASFGPNGPLKCSGLEVVRYDPESMHDEFGSDFQLLNSLEEKHETPFGSSQEFIYCYCRKTI